MTRAGFAMTIAAALAAGLSLTAAQRPTALAGIAGGLWEVSGTPGAKAPAHECVADAIALAQFEHRTAHCTRNIVSDAGTTTVVAYSCGSAGFGHSKLAVITPRSLRIETQGISGGLPFNYVLQARRVGECAKSTTASRH